MNTAGRYTPAEEVANSVTHGVGLLLSIAGALVLQLVISSGITARVSSAIFGTSLVALYATSTLYHAIPRPSAKAVLRVLDHSAIYLLIAGTYTPLALVGIQGHWGVALVVTVWSLAVVGVVTTLVSLERFKVLSMILYLAMGWLVVIAARQVVASLGPVEISLVFLGGVCYTGGLVFYGWRSLPFGHSLWHGCVLAGSVFHFGAVLLVVS